MITRFPLDLRPSLRFLLQDKYHYTPLQISDFLEGFNLDSLPPNLKDDVARLISGEPVNYIIGRLEFLGCQIDLSQKPLIPRPETEFWVETVIKKQDKDKDIRVLDLCCGSGCVGISVLSHLTRSQVDFVDIDKKILEQTRINLKLNHIATNRFQLFQSDLFKDLPPDSRYDLILANPPYVDEKGFISEELSYEPSLALFANDGGLQYLKQILLSASKYLAPTGYLYSEFGDDQKSALFLFSKANGLSVDFYPDQFGSDRYLCLTPVIKDF